MTVTLRNTPQWYVEYVEKWLETHRGSEAERVILEDIVTLMKVAASAMKPEPEKQETN